MFAGNSEAGTLFVRFLDVPDSLHCLGRHVSLRFLGEAFPARHRHVGALRVSLSDGLIGAYSDILNYSRIVGVYQV